jgi:hypothetical protein
MSFEYKILEKLRLKISGVHKNIISWIFRKKILIKDE